MLNGIIRSIFVILAVLVGYIYGERSFGATGYPGTLGASVGLCIASVLIACEFAFRHRFTRTLFIFLLGLGGGIALAFLTVSLLRLVVQNATLVSNIDIPLSLGIIYLVIMAVMHNADRFRVVIPFVEFRAKRVDESRVVLDLSALSDARLKYIITTGILGGRFVTHDAVLREAQRLSSSTEVRLQVQGRRAMDMISELRTNPDLILEIDASVIPRAKSPSDHVLEIARLEEARFVIADKDLGVLARAEEVRVIDLSEIGRLLLPKIQIGDALEVVVQKLGEERGQGIGFLDDGSMVIVTGGAEHIGKEVRISVRRLHHTTSGRMLFCDLLT